MQFSFMPVKKTTGALLVMRRTQKEHRLEKKRKKLYMCFVGIEKAFDGIPRKKAEWTLRKKG